MARRLARVLVLHVAVLAIKHPEVEAAQSHVAVALNVMPVQDVGRPPDGSVARRVVYGEASPHIIVLALVVIPVRVTGASSGGENEAREDRRPWALHIVPIESLDAKMLAPGTIRVEVAPILVR